MEILDLLALIFIPAVIAAGIGIAWQGLLSPAARYALALALAVGFAAGCWLYPDRVPLTPERHWHWLPYLGFIAAIVGSIAAFAPLPRWERKLLYLLLGGVAAFFQVPTWDNLLAIRPTLILLLAVYFALLITGMVYLPERLRGRSFVFLLMLAASGVAVLAMAEFSLRVGSVSLRAATALGGCWAASWLFPFVDKESNSRWPLLTAALIPVYVVLCGGGLFVVAIEPTPPKYLFLLVPAAPLMLWLFAWGPLSKLQGLAAIALQSFAVLSIPTIFLAVFFVEQLTGPDEWSSIPIVEIQVQMVEALKSE